MENKELYRCMQCGKEYRNNLPTIQDVDGCCSSGSLIEVKSEFDYNSIIRHLKMFLNFFKEEDFKFPRDYIIDYGFKLIILLFAIRIILDLIILFKSN